MQQTTKIKLHELEQNGTHVFHGSGYLIEEFEPRQAYDYIDGQQVPDGEPAVFASPFVDYAIFMALINEANCPHGYHSGSELKDGVLTFRATRDSLDQLNDAVTGYVYLFDKSDFVERNESEWVSHKKVKPVSMIQIHLSDFLPKLTQLLNSEERQNGRIKAIKSLIGFDGQIYEIKEINHVALDKFDRDASLAKLRELM